MKSKPISDRDLERLLQKAAPFLLERFGDDDGNSRRGNPWEVAVLESLPGQKELSASEERQWVLMILGMIDGFGRDGYDLPVSLEDHFSERPGVKTQSRTRS